MSLDVFLQAFRDGDAAPADPAAIAAILTPFIVTREASFASLKTADGEADCYGLGSDSRTINHASGRIIWDIVVNVAKEANLAIMPAGCAVCIVDQSARNHLPPELQDDVIYVRSGADLLDVIHGS